LARYTGPNCRICRAEGVKLFLKGNRCLDTKCAFDRRSYPPGEHGKMRKPKVTDYRHQLREKQKAKKIYGLQEKQFLLTFRKAERQKGITGENLLILLERRLDNVAQRLGFADSRDQARQLVSHGHVLVNNRKVTIPSYFVKKDDVVSIKEKTRKNTHLKDALESVKGRGIPKWLELDADKFMGKIVSLPTREDISIPVNEQLIIELYSK